jgi:hypothetical protein
MGNLNSRIDRVETAIEDTSGEKYRELCFHYNMRIVDDCDLCEWELALLERRPLDPDAERRLYAPIPPDTDQHLIDAAKARRDEPVRPIDTEKLWESFVQAIENKMKLDRCKDCEKAKRFKELIANEPK